MHSSIKIILLLLISFTCSKFSYSQDFAYKAGTFGFFHNQEYFNDYIEPQTMGGTRAYAQFGFQLNENQSIFAGANYLYEFGGEPAEQKLAPIVYFNFEHENLDVYLGSFPRYDIINMPELLLTDTLKYYRPNVEGIFLRGKTRWGYQNAWLDWTSRQTDVRREMFLVGLSGQVNIGSFFYRHHFVMLHNAGAGIRENEEHIQDNGGGLLGLGVDVSNDYVFDSLTLYAAYAVSYDQLRGIYDVYFHHGVLIEFNILYKRIGIRNSFYKGDGAMQELGDDFYTAKTYNRTDVYWKLFKQEWIEGYVDFGFHYVPGVLDLHQRFTIRVDVGGIKKSNFPKNAMGLNP